MAQLLPNESVSNESLIALIEKIATKSFYLNQGYLKQDELRILAKRPAMRTNPHQTTTASSTGNMTKPGDQWDASLRFG
jgi:hypothetical protein